MPTDTARTRAEAHADETLRPAQSDLDRLLRVVVIDAHEAGAAAQLAADIEVVEALQAADPTQRNGEYRRTLTVVLEALRRPRDE